jgi:hypothetical protein
VRHHMDKVKIKRINPFSKFPTALGIPNRSRN